MKNFNYFNGTRYIFGKNSELNVAEILKQFNAQNVLIVYGSKHAKNSGLIDRISNNLKENNINYFELGGVVTNPRDSLVYDGISLTRKNNVDFILAVGGGSVIDTAKAIGLGHFYNGDFKEIYMTQKCTTGCLPIGVILTISAAGSESSTNSVINFTNEGVKKGFACEQERPKFAILNPELTYSLPDYAFYAGFVDIFAHLLERYFSPTESVYISKGMLEGVMHSMLFDLIPLLKKDRKDYEANANLMWAGTLAHNDILGCDRVQDWGSHKLSYGISYKYDTLHGATLAILFPAWLKYNYSKNIDLFYDFATRVMDVEKNDNKEKVILEGIEKFKLIIKNDLHMPVSLSEIGIKEDEIPELVEYLFKTVKQPIGLFNPFTKESARQIYLLALK